LAFAIGVVPAASNVNAIMERTRLLTWLLVLVLAVPLPAVAHTAPAQTAPPGQPAAAPSSGGSDVVFTPLVAQVLMASTHPLEVVQAARFVKANPKLQGDQLNEKLKDYDWEDSVKSLVNVGHS